MGDLYGERVALYIICPLFGASTLFSGTVFIEPRIVINFNRIHFLARNEKINKKQQQRLVPLPLFQKLNIESSMAFTYVNGAKSIFCKQRGIELSIID